MIPRYSHPQVSEVHSDADVYHQWLEIERATLLAQLEQGVIADRGALEAHTALAKLWIDQKAVKQIQAIERDYTHHDVAAFLAWVRKQVRSGQWIHFGLTSSDVVDTAMGLRFHRLHRPMLQVLGDLTSALTRFTLDDQPMLGLTHGQAAEPTSIRARGWNWLAYVETPIVQLSQLTKRMAVCKLSGPVGTFAHNPPLIEAQVATILELIPMGPGASQIVPRSTLAMWASTVASLLSAYSKIALDLRLLATQGEVYWARKPEHVASSSMAHKNNPVEAEQMAGFARMARGFAAMLQDVDTWLERDIANSSVERVAVLDLWHLLFTGTARMAALLEGAILRPLIIEDHLATNSNAAWTHKHTLGAIQDGMSYQEARDYALGFDTESYDVVGDARRFMDNYPVGPKR